MHQTLPHQWLTIYAGTDPEAVALVAGDETLSYGELDHRVAAAAGRWAEDGLQPGEIIAYRATLTVDTIVDMLAIGRIGGVFAPYGPHRVAGEGTLTPAMYVVVPTSGSSGHPRGVLLTGDNVAAAVDASSARLGNGPTDRWLLTLPLFHVGGLAVVWRSLAAGGSIDVHERFDAEDAVRALRHGGITMASLVPTMLRRILDLDSGPYRGLRAILLGGAPAPAALVERALAAGLPVLQTYGMTEACSQVATVQPGQALASLGTAGLPLDGFTVGIVDGEIVVDGPAVSPGYLGQPPRGGPHRTGDLGWFDASGRLIVEGRKGHVIISGGENVPASTVEAAIGAHRDVRNVAVVGVPDDEWGEIVVAVVETDPAVLADVQRDTRRRLAPHEVPKRWIVVEHLPVMPGGKPDRRAIEGLATTPPADSGR